MKKLCENYTASVRPARGVADKVPVRIGLTLSQFISLVRGGFGALLGAAGGVGARTGPGRPASLGLGRGDVLAGVGRAGRRAANGTPSWARRTRGPRRSPRPGQPAPALHPAGAALLRVHLPRGRGRSAREEAGPRPKRRPV